MWKKDMFWTTWQDWRFIIAASSVWVSSLVVTAWDFTQLQDGIYRFGPINLLALLSMATGVIIRLSARMTLGKNYSPRLRVREDHVLVRHGIYRHVRHPAYSGTLLFDLGTPLLFSSIYGFLIMLLLIPCILYRIRIEEEMLIEKFGSEYVEYMKNSRKLIPFLY